MELTADGYDVTGCPDGASALDDAAKRRYDCVITDYRMPRMNGLEATKHLRSLFPSATIIGVSIIDRQEDFINAGADAFLLKPYQYDDLLALISVTKKN